MGSSNNEESINAMRKFLDSHYGDDDVMIVGHGIVARGELEGCKKLVVNGHYEGDFNGEKLCVGENGKFVGDVSVDTAIILGHYEGKLDVNGLLEVGCKGVVEGFLSCKSIKTDEGAVVSATVEEITI